MSLEAMAATMGEDPGTLEDVVEPYLLQIGFLARTRQGRRLTPAATEHLQTGQHAGSMRPQTPLFSSIVTAESDPQPAALSP